MPHAARAQFRSDDEALSAARAGDGQGYAALFNSFGPALRSFVARRGAEDPDGMVNAVLFAAFDKLDGFAGEAGDFRSYIYRIARNQLIDEYRRTSRRVKTVAGSPREQPTEVIEDVVGSFVASDERVTELLGTLTTEQREVLVLRVVEDLSLAETSEIVGKPVGAVKALQRRAVRSLHRSMAKEVHE